ncbi:SagB family peptide dehydrogenase [Nocardia sp. 2]|uniref:SagB family peptide dehydrogenase n=1 Tax=Nocardia acididurans TaxID=2802282 RepID=A0ABS1M9A7_9NOCA|nr:SagB family peptide dehydrogenase [Nocardia acididurans]MBL1077225.1 SagB family peptide dehydrogenase [Nocardia acididurans]
MSVNTTSTRDRYALREGVTCLLTADGALLLDPPKRKDLPALSPNRLQAMRILKAGPLEAEQAADPDVGALLDELTAEGWLATTVRDGDRELYTIRPFTTPPARSADGDPRPDTLSKFALLHRDSDGFVLEHPLSWCDLRVHDARVLALLGGQSPADSGLDPELVARLAQDLRWGGFTVAATDSEDERFTTRSWSAPDLWFHRRSTLGPRTLTWEHFGPTKWAKPSFPQPIARKPAYPGEAVALTAPDLDSLRITDPSLTDVLEDRYSCRAFDEAAPITADQLGELLYRAARTRGVRSAGPGEELVSRPYPSGGSVYELEIYPIIRHVSGLESGMYHYDSFDHVLRPVAPIDSPAVQKLISSTSATLADGGLPQVVLVVAARSGRVMWTYEQVAYASILKHVGVLMQTVYLAATAMGLGTCAQGFSDTAAFVGATGVDELEECNVGSIIIGSPAANAR